MMSADSDSFPRCLAWEVENQLGPTCMSTRQSRGHIQRHPSRFIPVHTLSVDAGVVLDRTMIPSPNNKLNHASARKEGWLASQANTCSPVGVARHGGGRRNTPADQLSSTPALARWMSGTGRAPPWCYNLSMLVGPNGGWAEFALDQRWVISAHL